MKRFFSFAMMIALVSAPAFAAKNSEMVSFPAVRAGSTQLAAGDYDVAWSGSGSNAEATLSRNRKVVATVPVKLVAEKNKETTLDLASDGGVEVLQAIHLKNATLVLNAPSEK